ncbi:MAG: hypothetical protein DRO15_05110 [Thermoprotei archaeon]|nr:MAG: hypothetical protein DRO15_05110 [Thermoprotei archaeon]
MMHAFISITEEGDIKKVHVSIYNSDGRKIIEKIVKCKIIEISGWIRISRISPTIIIAEVSKGHIEERGNIILIR